MSRIDMSDRFGRAADGGENVPPHRRNLDDPGSAPVPKGSTLTLGEWKAAQAPDEEGARDG